MAADGMDSACFRNFRQIRRTAVWLRWWMLTPAFAALLTIAFVAGRLTERSSQASGISEKARERVLLMSLSDHLEQSQIVLANVANADPGSRGFSRRAGPGA